MAAPLSQLFIVENELSDDVAVFLSKIDVYFGSKSDRRGVVLEVREVVNGYPTSRRVPFSRVRLRSSEVNVSDDGSVATSFVFDSPVAIKTDKPYCFVIKPHADDPDYQLFVAKSFEADLISGTNIGSYSTRGVLFTSSNDSTWIPLPDERLKYSIYCKRFNTSGTMYLTNKNTEFFTIDTIVGNFETGEELIQFNANATGTATTNTSSTTVTGSGFSIFNAGDHIAYYANTTVIDVVEIATVVSDTQIALTETPKYANTSTNYFKTIIGDIILYDRNDPGRLYIDDSTASGSQKFEANNTVYGVTSGASANIASVDDFKVSYLQSNLYKSTLGSTRVQMSASRLYRTDTNTTYGPVKIPFGKNKNMFIPTIIKSRSNEIIDDSGEKSFRLKVDLTSNSRFITPTVDFDASSINAYEYVVNNTVDDGTTTELDGDEAGPAESKYISKQVILADQLDAEDIKVFVSAFKPNISTIRVYARFKSENDPREFDTIEWSELVIKPETDTSSAFSNFDDIREFEYNLPSQPSGDFSSGSGAALNSSNSNIIRYIDDNGVIYNNYKSFAIKIVMLSNSHRNVPRLQDVRAIALT